MSPSPFEVVREEEPGRVRLRPRGELDLATAAVLEAELERTRSAALAVVLDLDELTFIDSTGLGLLLGAVTQARANGWALVVTGGSAEVLRLLELTGTRDIVYGRTPL